jgi:hypothetical protein
MHGEVTGIASSNYVTVSSSNEPRNRTEIGVYCITLQTTPQTGQPSNQVSIPGRGKKPFFTSEHALGPTQPSIQCTYRQRFVRDKTA